MLEQASTPPGEVCQEQEPEQEHVELMGQGQGSQEDACQEHAPPAAKDGPDQEQRSQQGQEQSLPQNEGRLADRDRIDRRQEAADPGQAAVFVAYQDQKDHPDWLLLHRIGEIGVVDEALARSEVRYVLERVARYSDLSGWHWLLYRKQRP